MTKKTTLRNSLQFATRTADFLYHTQLAALNLNLYADEAHKQRLLSTLGLVTAVRDQLNYSIPSLDYLRRQCSAPTPGNRSRVIETLKAGGKNIPNVLKGFFQELPSFVQADTAQHETALAAAPKLSALPELLDQARQLAESGSDLKLIKELLD